MYKEIYVASDNSIMSESDLITWLAWVVENNTALDEIDFDSITGGVDDFFEVEDYYRVKNIFKNLKVQKAMNFIRVK
jgi:hypothetical protein